ncbi:MAG: hypothetical protein AB7H92_03910 [Microbacteriaceae bacterium]
MDDDDVVEVEVVVGCGVDVGASVDEVTTVVSSVEVGAAVSFPEHADSARTPASSQGVARLSTSTPPG